MARQALIAALLAMPICRAKPVCFMLLMHCVRAAASRTFCTAGANFLFADGAVRMLTNDTPLQTLKYLANRADNKTFSTPW